MALVSYSDSDDAEDEEVSRRSSKKRKLSQPDSPPPPLPASFHSLYSHSVRVSTTDDPSLHGGKKRIVPHVQGNWPSHVQLEWHPSHSHHELLSSLVSAVADAVDAREHPIHPLLTSDLAVPAPLHISLSAPLVLKTHNKDAFCESMLAALTPVCRMYRAGIAVRPVDLAWHYNEDRTRAFLVLQVADEDNEHNDAARYRQIDVDTGTDAAAAAAASGNVIDESPVAGQQRKKGPLERLLAASNRVAAAYSQPQLYAGHGVVESKARVPADSTGVSGVAEGHDSAAEHIDMATTSTKPSARGDFSGSFHISIAWALAIPSSPSRSATAERHKTREPKSVQTQHHPTWSPEVKALLDTIIKDVRIAFADVKVKVGREVTSVAFGGGHSGLGRRGGGAGLFGV